MYWWT
ncbi:hypothetical protein LINGRAHAP2_LOCUS25551 [Linum grandiflorum]